MNLSAILKMLGVRITPEQTVMIETIIPQIPAKAMAIIQAVNDFGERQKRLEENQAEMRRMLFTILEELSGKYSGDTRPAGIGLVQSSFDGTNGIDRLD